MKNNIVKPNGNPRATYFDGDYYKLKIIIESSQYKKLVEAFLKKFADFGSPIPDSKFKDEKSFWEWNDKIFSPAIKRMVRRKTNKITIPSAEKGIIKILKNFEINSTDKNYLFFWAIWNNIFFNKDPERDSFSIRFKNIRYYGQSKKAKEETGLYIKIYPWTRKEDINDKWQKYIIPLQMKLPGYRGKNKACNNFYRDMEIYKKYKEFLEIQKENHKLKQWNGYKKRLDEIEITKQINSQYNCNLNTDGIRSVYHDIRRLRKSCGF
ncbi:MAG: hypothetical protein WCV92_02315 [Candidatus Buchananbacteria bacterium]